MQVTLENGVLRAGSEARERFYDSRGYGRPRGGDLELAPVEAAHLLFRGDLDAVHDPDSPHNTTLDFADLLASVTVSEVSFFVYKDLRDRGFYLSPVDGGTSGGEGPIRGREFVVYPRGQGPWDDDVAYRVGAVSEREDVSTAEMAALVNRAQDDGATAVLAVVDEESEVTYLELCRPTIEGATDHDIEPENGTLLSDRVLVSTPSSKLHDSAFYGQRLDPDGPIQLSLVEATHLARTDRLTLGASGGEGGGSETHADGGPETLLDRGREIEGARFDRRLEVYSTLRDAGIVPKTGFKFGADFRTYAAVESVDSLGHSELLVRVLPASHVFAPRDLALDVRLAHGVRKQMVYAFVDEETSNKPISWLAVERLTP